MDDQCIVGSLISLFVIWSVGRTNHRPTADRPTTDFFYNTTRSLFEYFVLWFNISPFPSGWLAVVELLTHACKSLVKFEECFIESLWGIYSSLS